ncbi:DUF2934 domain-containing protein [Roseomonas xinghualingensis]|uniref:DUF2934 domain-containing protein n=1 Tax=Roseomonas xinghualingensis TaxID=2986475 RepID=UPI0021F1BC25|nr:DUF2934 domain-containing protein [Roseomonas sp. SXEYE001]MCV4206323.1 DUF2934 domain-containing protein [Roseomonas sp. SXEYE001]
MMRIVTGLFDEHRTVDLVVEHLVQEFGIPRERVQVHAMEPSSGEEARSTQDCDQETSLPDLGLPQEAVQVYGEGMRHGGILLATWVDDAWVDRALATYGEYGATSPKAYEMREPGAADDWEQRVRVRAYHLWEQEGRPEGRALEFWDRACAAEDAPGQSARR